MHVKGTLFNMEIALIKNFEFGLFPGLFIMTGAARFVFLPLFFTFRLFFLFFLPFPTHKY